MKIYILTAFFVFIVFNSYTQAPLNYWAHGFGGSGTDYGYNVAMSANTGDIFITGYFSGVSSFGSDIELISSGYEDVYILKLTKKGSLLWAVKAGGDSLDVGKNIVLDEAGNIYIVGYFKSSSLDFGNGIMIQSSGLEDIFIAKYNSSGQCIWAKGFGNNKLDQGYGIAYQTNTLYISGTFTDTIDFGNGIEINSSSPAGRDIFWAKFDIDGNCLLAKGAGSVYTDHSNSIYVDNFENVFITGYFEDTAYFDSYFVVSNGQSDIFLAQYNSVGQCNWVTGIGDSLDDYGKALVTDNYGNCYLTGNFADNPDFGNGNVLSSVGDHDIFICKYDPSGNCLWAKSAGGANWDGAYGIAQFNDTVLITGHFYGTADFGDGTFLISNGADDIFLATYNSAGNLLWTWSGGSTGTDFGYGIVTDDALNSYITGFFSDSAFFGNDTLITNGERDIFLTQIIRCAGINGSVSLFSGNLLPEGSTTMYLYEIISSNTSEYIQSIELDGNMEFSFDCIPAGHYIVQAKLINHVEYPGILNTYYGDTHKWPDATIIDINAEDTLNIHIQMIEMLPISNGVGHIYGRIRLADDGLKGTGEPLSGIEVTIEQDPEPIANDVSDEDGQYEFTGVTLGTYTLGVDFAGNDSIIGVPQIQTCTIAVTSTDTLFADINFIVDTSATYHGIYIDTTGSFISFFKLPDLNLLIYPNPFDETVNVDYVLNNTGKVTIDIYDLMGRKLNTIFCEVLPEGHYHQSFLLSPYIPSVYFIKFTYKDYILLKKIVKH